jgi:hypothetical protein
MEQTYLIQPEVELATKLKSFTNTHTTSLDTTHPSTISIDCSSIEHLSEGTRKAP